MIKFIQVNGLLFVSLFSIRSFISHHVHTEFFYCCSWRVETRLYVYTSDCFKKYEKNLCCYFGSDFVCKSAVRASIIQFVSERWHRVRRFFSHWNEIKKKFIQYNIKFNTIYAFFLKRKINSVHILFIL